MVPGAVKSQPVPLVRLSNGALANDLDSYSGTLVMKRFLFGFAAVCALILAMSQGGTGGAAERSSSGEYFDDNGVPTYHVGKDGTVDWFTYSGFRRYHSDCHVCHGPDALGSSFAPSLAESLKTLSYDDFVEIVVNGRENVGTSQQNKMPAFGLNLNVMCYLDDIYIYLKARSDGAIPRGRPSKKEAKSDEARADESACMGG